MGLSLIEKYGLTAKKFERRQIYWATGILLAKSIFMNLMYQQKLIDPNLKLWLCFVGQIAEWNWASQLHAIIVYFSDIQSLEA